MTKTTVIKMGTPKLKTYSVSFPNLPVVEYEVANPEVALENYRVQFNLSPDRPYRAYTIKEVFNGD
jgi:hypothetical protein